MPVAVLTGVGHKGQVGEAVAARLAADGYELVLVDRTPDGVNARAGELSGSGARATGYACDLSDALAVERLFAEIAKRHGPTINSCVHMAGGFSASGPVAETAILEWDRQLTINLRTAFLVTRSAIPLLREARGSIVLFSSESAIPGAKLSRISAYAVAKSGVATLATAISQEERDNGVRCNVLAPSAIRTASNEASMPSGSRFVEREDVAATVAYLCSDAARALTGQLLRLTPR